MKSGILEKLLNGRSISKNATELDRMLDAIILLEKRRDKAKIELDKAKARLEQAMTNEILSNNEPVNHDKLTAAILAAEARHTASEKLLADAKRETTKIIGAGIKGRKDEIIQLQEKISKVRQAIDRRKVRIISEFAATYGFKIEWGSKHNGGNLLIPVISIEQTEVSEIQKTVIKKTSFHIDEDQDKLNQLLADKQKLEIMDRGNLELAVSSLLNLRRRGE